MEDNKDLKPAEEQSVVSAALAQAEPEEVTAEPIGDQPWDGPTVKPPAETGTAPAEEKAEDKAAEDKPSTITGDNYGLR